MKRTSLAQWRYLHQVTLVPCVACCFCCLLFILPLEKSFHCHYLIAGCISGQASRKSTLSSCFSMESNWPKLSHCHKHHPKHGQGGIFECMKSMTHPSIQLLLVFLPSISPQTGSPRPACDTNLNQRVTERLSESETLQLTLRKRATTKKMWAITNHPSIHSVASHTFASFPPFPSPHSISGGLNSARCSVWSSW